MRTDWMKGALFGAIVAGIAVVGLTAGAHKNKQRDTVTVDRAAMEQSLGDLLDQLGVIERLNDKNRDVKIRKKIHAKIHDLREDLDNLHGQFDTPALDLDDDRDDDDRWYDPGTSDTRDTRHWGTVTSEMDFERLMNELGEATTSKGKLAVLRDAAKTRWFTVAQLTRVMDDLSFSSDRVEACVILYANLSDPENFYLAYSHLPFESDKDDLRGRLGVK